MKNYRLWDGDAPGALGTSDSDVPTLTDYGSPGTSGRPACIVCPGGGYSGLADYEGEPVAEWFESLGVRGFVLKYRLGPRYHHPVELGDAERAMRLVRSKAHEVGVDANRIGICGFSAGGHLASTLCTHFSQGNSQASDPIEKVTSKPDWAVLIYPVIEMREPFAHAGSREMLLGKNPTETDLNNLSNSLAVSLDTPQTFLCHGADDAIVPVQNSLEYAMALAGHKIPFELHVPQSGAHGFGLGRDETPTDWKPRCEQFLKSRRIL